ncbi:rid1 [Apiospora phragmitis]|uniref:DNA (cytosine-5-)-methyltransferase n=1 Tax=Apiospora phragmitis TaxID=2905665 RepID=A0ABR1VF68_9PEZI
MAQQFLVPRDTPVIDLDDDDDEQLRHEVEQVIDLTGEADEPQVQEPAFRLNLPPLHPLQVIDRYQHHGYYIEIGSCVEVFGVPAKYQAEFLKVTAIDYSRNGVSVSGLPFTRTRNFDGKFPCKLNEVCLVVDSTRSDLREEEIQAEVTVPLDDVIQLRTLEFTNADYPAYRYRLRDQENNRDAEENGRLICRWKCQRIWANAVARRADRPPAEFVILHMGPGDIAKDAYRVSEMNRFNIWQAGKTRDAPNFGNVPIQGHVGDIQPRGRSHEYSFGDIFCGAGGASCGAREAGLDVQMACDMNEAACNSYRANFPTTQVYKEEIHEFINDKLYSGFQLDIVHFSPPCQPFSPAHTRAGKNDDDNEAALFACTELVKRIRPRIFTLEETYGILSHEDFFNALVGSFTGFGYSVRWKVEHLWNWGNPCRRLRLIMIGSCPGEPLPDFPKSTHSPNGAGNTKRYVTVADALSQIPGDQRRLDSSHDIWAVKHFDPRKASWNSNVPLPRTIVTSGAGNYHPSGIREFTCRELATLSSFPVNYVFNGRIGEKETPDWQRLSSCSRPSALETYTQVHAAD